MSELRLIPAVLSHTIQAGDEYGFTLSVQSGGAPVDLTAYTVESRIAPNVSYTAGAPIAWNVTPDAADPSKIRLWLSGDETRALNPSSSYEVQLVRSVDGVTRTYLRGEIRRVAELLA